MRWEEILELNAWVSLRQLPIQPEEVLHRIYRVGTDAFAHTLPYDRSFNRNNPDAPFVTLAFWAPSMKALKRCAGRDPSVVPEEPIVLPPAPLLLGTSGTYRQLRDAVPASDRWYAEKAIYSNRGLFVHKVIELGRFRYCFLQREIRDDELPYSIEVSLLQRGRNSGRC
ncbi:MAG TPA: hypothetical protein PLP42_06440 [Acidobacteriota bacterium]|jgi:hypothetical protein|nr:hypothetical protein [Acidobacteriota bacterium]